MQGLTAYDNLNTHFRPMLKAGCCLQAGAGVAGAEPSELGLGGLNISDAVNVVAGGLESVLRHALLL